VATCRIADLTTFEKKCLGRVTRTLITFCPQNKIGVEEFFCIISIAFVTVIVNGTLQVIT